MGDSLAAFRRGMGPEMGKLAEEHFKHEYDGIDIEGSLE